MVIFHSYVTVYQKVNPLIPPRGGETSEKQPHRASTCSACCGTMRAFTFEAGNDAMKTLGQQRGRNNMLERNHMKRCFDTVGLKTTFNIKGTYQSRLGYEKQSKFQDTSKSLASGDFSLHVHDPLFETLHHIVVKGVAWPWHRDKSFEETSTACPQRGRN